MNKASINPTNLQELFDSASNAADKGQAQWFTPFEWGKLLASPLEEYRPVICDLTCGSGELLRAASRHGSKLLGCDIESTELDHFVHADITHFFQLLVDVDWRGDSFVLNPPWDLHWYRDRLQALVDPDCYSVTQAFEAHDGRVPRETIDSSVATLCMAINRSSSFGEGLQVWNESTLQRLVLGPRAPHAALSQHIWAHVVIEGNICSTGKSEGFKTGIAYFARSHTSGVQIEARAASLDEARTVIGELRQSKRYHFHGAPVRDFLATQQIPEIWDAAAMEWQRLTDVKKAHWTTAYNIWLAGDADYSIIRTNISLFDTRSGRVSNEDAAALYALNGKQPIQLVVQPHQRKALQMAVAPGSPWRVDPKLQAAVDAAIAQYHAVRSPIVPLSEIQRLGYLDEHDHITCRKDLRRKGMSFRKGRDYALRSTTVAVRRLGTKTNIYGDVDQVEWNGLELAFFIKDDSDVECVFMEARLQNKAVTVNILKPGGKPHKDKDLENECAIDFTLHELAEHFIIPEVPDIATLDPVGYRRNLQLLDEIETLCQ